MLSISRIELLIRRIKTMSIVNNKLKPIQLQRKSLELRNRLKINTFYIEFFLPAIPLRLLQNSETDDLIELLENLAHLTGKRLVGERSILDNKLAYKNLSITQNKNIKKGKQAA